MYLIHFRRSAVPSWPQTAATFATRLAVNLSAMIKLLSTTAASKLRRKLKTRGDLDQQILQIKYVNTNDQKLFHFFANHILFGGFWANFFEAGTWSFKRI